MLKTLTVKNFTVFTDVTFEFSPGLNVIVGENGTGKTHVLKLGYLFSRAWPDLMNKRLRMTAQRANIYLSDRLAGLFQVSDLSALVQKNQPTACLHAEVVGYIPTFQSWTAEEPEFLDPGLTEPMSWRVQIQRGSAGAQGLQVTTLPETAAVNAFLPQQVFVPSKEMVSLFKGLVALFEKYREFPLDETYRDLAVAMSTLALQEAPLLNASAMQKIQDLLGGYLKLDHGDLFFEQLDGSRLEVTLMAEGHRKLALLIYLLRYGVLEKGSTLFWDEPEANLNPAASKLLAAGLHLLARLGIQVVLTTHSYFLLKELALLAQQNPVPLRFMGLNKLAGGIALQQADSLLGLDHIVALDEELAQYDRELSGGSHV
jgi:hypothetical protein